jgi:DNA-binding NarL/FixJ family response regulator
VNPLSLVAVDSQPIVLEGLQRVLEPVPELRLVGLATSLGDALELVRQKSPHLVLVDQQPGLKVVFQFLVDARCVAPACQPVLFVSDMAEIDCFRALQMGARGIVRKTLPPQSLLDCLRAVGAGNVWIENTISNQVVGFLNRKQAPRLTPRERDIVRHVCAGLKNKEIAEALSITAGTVKVHLMHIFEKTGVKDRFELAVQGRRLLGPEMNELIAGATLTNSNPG